MTRRRQALSTGLMAFVLARLDARAHTGAGATGMAPAAAQRLDALDANPGLAGDVVYWGEVFPMAAPAGTAAPYRYARRVLALPAGLSAAHLTYGADGRLLIEERVSLSEHRSFQRLDVANRQTLESGSAVLSPDGRQLHFSWTSAGTTRTSVEAVDAPVVAGPSLHGTMLQHWDTLRAGEVLRVRLAVPSRLESHGFDIRLSQEADGHTVFSATPASWLVRLAVAPLRATFDTATRSLVRYEGRVPPMQARDNGKLAALDARVLYTPQANGYR